MSKSSKDIFLCFVKQFACASYRILLLKRLVAPFDGNGYFNLTGLNKNVKNTHYILIKNAPSINPISLMVKGRRCLDIWNPIKNCKKYNKLSMDGFYDGFANRRDYKDIWNDMDDERLTSSVRFNIGRYLLAKYVGVVLPFKLNAYWTKTINELDLPTIAG